MKQVDVLVVGGGICGYTAAMAARRYYGDKKIGLLRKGLRALIPWCLAYNCARGAIHENILRDDRLYDEGIELIIDEVTGIDRNRKGVFTACGKEIKYEKLILATGSMPQPPPFKDDDLYGVFSFKKEYPYLQNLSVHLDSATDVVIVGGGLTGIEFAEACSATRQRNITLVEQRSRLLEWAFDEEIGNLMEDNLRQRGVNIITAARVEEVYGNKRVEGVKLTNGQVIPADTVILATGILPNTALARAAGLATHECAGILVDAYMRTTDENIFAVGDCIIKKNLPGPEGAGVRLALEGGRDARIAAANLFTLKRSKEAIIDKFTLAIGNKAFGVVGLLQNRQAAGAYMMTAGEIAVKVIYSPETGTAVAAQVHGTPFTLVREIMDRMAGAIKQQTRFDEISLV